MSDLVKVKPLEWHKSHMPSWNGDFHTFPTAYTVRCADEYGWKWSGPGGVVGYASSPEAAMAAAQADYTARIRAALDLAGIEAMQAEIKRLKEVLTEIAGMAPLEQPPPAYDDYGWQIADTPERHADRVEAIAIWDIANIARAALKEDDNG